MDGLIVVDKPGGMTSHDVVARIRRLAKTRRVGHGGTLDPMATGVLIIGVNRATRLLTYVIGSEKRYTATIRLGESTVTDDAEGDVTARASTAAVTDDAIRAELGRQVGEIDQVPSAVSAIKINGQRAYKRVRDGEDVEIPARRITIYRLDIVDIRRPAQAGARPERADIRRPVEAGLRPERADIRRLEEAGLRPEGADIRRSGGADAGPEGAAAGPERADARPERADVRPEAADAGTEGAAFVDVDIDVTCSSGTYIRAIARDLGTALGVGGHLTALRRTAVGGLTLAEASTLSELEERAPDVIGLPMAEAAARAFPRRDATEEEARVLSHGGPLEAVGIDGPYAVFDPAGALLAIVSEQSGRAKPEIVLAPA
ncbi:MAG TPA: tRNA pseudouridine(55) synthase TruB [Actinoplanes sp.]|nr:tRNA pseudouridine(55) synthase TruB [Actinoplanes sp.]